MCSSPRAARGSSASRQGAESFAPPPPDQSKEELAPPDPAAAFCSVLRTHPPLKHLLTATSKATKPEPGFLRVFVKRCILLLSCLSVYSGPRL